MPATTITAAPFIPVAPLIQIGDDTTGVAIECAAGELSVEVEQDESTISTFCGEFTSYKGEVWTVTINAYQSYGSGGLWTLLRPLVGTPVEFTILPDRSAVVSVDNPSFAGECIVKAFPFYMGAVGEPTAFDIVLAVQGAPVESIVPGAMAMGADRYSADSGQPAELEPAEQPAQ